MIIELKWKKKKRKVISQKAFRKTYAFLAEFGMTDSVDGCEFLRVYSEFQKREQEGTGPRTLYDLMTFIIRRANILSDGQEPTDHDIAKKIKKAVLLEL